MTLIAFHGAQAPFRYIVVTLVSLRLTQWLYSLSLQSCHMRRLISISVGLLIVLRILSLNMFAEERQVYSARKIVSRAMPVYPELARKMNLEGSVKLLVMVAPNGTVKSIQAKGGSPVLLRAAEDSVYKFRWALAKDESKELVEMRFHPE